MRRERERSVAAWASSRVAMVIARELELLATRRGRLLAFDVDEIEALAEHLAELAVSARPSMGLIDARYLAEELGVARDWIYANADRLGGVRLGDGPGARLRFDAERAREALAADGDGDRPSRTRALPRRRGRPTREGATVVPLIQGRSSR
jgi:hypothetical protein